MLKALKPKIALGAAVLAAFLLALIPASPARAGTVADAANEFLKKTFDLRYDYFKAENEAGKALREIALQGDASEDWPMLAWGDAHGDKKADSKGRTQYRYVGYSYFGEDVTNPFFPPDETAGGRLDQRNWIEEPWNDSRTEHLIYDSRFDTQTNPWLAERLRWGLYWAARCNGFDPPDAASDLYRNPQKYVHVILPPAEGTWGMGRMWHVTSGGRVWYVSVPLGPPEEAPKTPNFFVKSLDPGCPKNEKGEYVAEAGRTYTAAVVFGVENTWPDRVMFPAVASVAAAHKVGSTWYRAELSGTGSASLAGARFASAGASDVLAWSPRWSGAELLPWKVRGYQAVAFYEDKSEVRLAFAWTAENSPATLLAAAVNVLYPREGPPLVRPIAWEGGEAPQIMPATPEEAARQLAEVMATVESQSGSAFEDNVAEAAIKVNCSDLYVKTLNPGTARVEQGKRYTGTVVFGLRDTVGVPVEATLELTHNGWSVSGVDGRKETFNPGQEKSFTFSYTGQDRDSVLVAKVRPVEGNDADWTDNVKHVVVPLEREEPAPSGSGSLTFQAVSQTRSKTRPAGTAKWTDWVTATLKPPMPDPPRSDAWIEDWWVESASLTYPKKNPDFTIGCPYPPVGTRTIAMTVQGDKHTAKAEFQEDWAIDGAPVYCLLEGRMMAETPKQYTITASYRLGYRYAWLEERTGYYTCYDSEGNPHTCSYTYYVKCEATGSSSGTLSGKLLVNGTGVDSRAQ